MVRLAYITECVCCAAGALLLGCLLMLLALMLFTPCPVQP
jgi:hypothetical protein